MLPLMVGVAGAAGALVRFWLDYLLSTRLACCRIPLATALVNVAGSAGAGALTAWHRQSSHDPLFTVVGVGFLGGLTTFSSLLVASAQLWRGGRRRWACLNVLIHLAGGLGGAWGGYQLTLLVSPG